ncbi:hypothetical protein E3_0210 [Rhodococcus phage E3]|uniref:hypothetical protein n=1 Tax=Rhodococcus phage E3 TaxID=1007869 RepID=UPI0002C6BEC7|nr:hypothetical protein M176_gp022 [Rhodococcus phage E3]AEQ20932.1 hypothetical protein E3_0210 [Rhodococcus phage E3]
MTSDDELAAAQAKVARWERHTQRRQNEFNTAEARLNESKRWLRKAHSELDVIHRSRAGQP